MDSYRLGPVSAADDKNPTVWDALFLAARLALQRNRVLEYGGNR
jgi:hypothetical protein